MSSSIPKKKRFLPLSHELTTFFLLRDLTLDGIDGLSEAANVVAGDAGDGDTAVLGSVDRELLSETGHLISGQTSVGEHADLASDVGPVVLGAELLKVVLEEGTHGDDSVSHLLDLIEPLLVEDRVGEDLRGDTGTVDRGVGVQGSDDNLELGVDALLLLGAGADEGEGTNTLTVETLVTLSVSALVTISASEESGDLGI